MIRNWGRRSQPVDLPCATAALRPARRRCAASRPWPATWRVTAGR